MGLNSSPRVNLALADWNTGKARQSQERKKVSAGKRNGDHSIFPICPQKSYVGKDGSEKM